MINIDGVSEKQNVTTIVKRSRQSILPFSQPCQFQEWAHETQS